eukprot:IDg15460t1
MAFASAALCGSRTVLDTSFAGSRKCVVRSEKVQVVANRAVLRACASPAAASATSAKTEDETPLKRFLNNLGGLGKVRLVTNNGLAVLESITPLDKLFYASVRGAEYGNVIDHKLNVDLHIKLDAVAGARFEIGKSRTKPPHPTYAIRMLDHDRETVKLSLFMQWDATPDDVASERVAHWQSLKSEYAGDDDIAWISPLRLISIASGAPPYDADIPVSMRQTRASHAELAPGCTVCPTTMRRARNSRSVSPSTSHATPSARK